MRWVEVWCGGYGVGMPPPSFRRRQDPRPLVTPACFPSFLRRQEPRPRHSRVLPVVPAEAGTSPLRHSRVLPVVSAEAGTSPLRHSGKGIRDRVLPVVPATAGTSQALVRRQRRHASQAADSTRRPRNTTENTAVGPASEAYAHDPHSTISATASILPRTLSSTIRLSAVAFSRSETLLKGLRQARERGCNRATSARHLSGASRPVPLFALRVACQTSPDGVDGPLHPLP